MAGHMKGRQHSEACRNRMEAALEKEGNQRWKNAKTRKEDKFWEAIAKEEERMQEENLSETPSEKPEEEANTQMSKRQALEREESDQKKARVDEGNREDESKGRR